ncbi:MAG: sulfurtransferase TusA family protein [Chloroflexi bacterium]|nr:sulfurtransferase TusA family protein [Chloroflexota bacterium]
MTAETETRPTITRTIDARGSFCPGPLMELIRAIREGAVGDVIAVRSSDSGSKIDIPKWIEKAGHRLIAVDNRDGFDEIIVEKAR